MDVWPTMISYVRDLLCDEPCALSLIETCLDGLGEYITAVLLHIIIKWMQVLFFFDKVCGLSRVPSSSLLNYPASRLLASVGETARGATFTTYSTFLLTFRIPTSRLRWWWSTPWFWHFSLGRLIFLPSLMELLGWSMLAGPDDEPSFI